MHKDASQTVTRRRVFYIPGFDPMPPRRYRELYRAEGAEQAAISGYEIDIARAKTGTGYGWQVAAHGSTGRTQADIDVLVWSDIVRTACPTSILGTYGATAAHRVDLYRQRRAVAADAAAQGAGDCGPLPGGDVAGATGAGCGWVS